MYGGGATSGKGRGGQDYNRVSLDDFSDDDHSSQGDEDDFVQHSTRTQQVAYHDTTDTTTGSPTNCYP